MRYGHFEAMMGNPAAARIRRSHSLVAVSVGLLSVPVNAVDAQDLWAGLEPGPFAVGFSVVEARDSARSLANGDKRPLQISYWYPAEATDAPSSAARVNMRDYFVLTATELTLEPLEPGEAEAAVEGFKRFMASNDVSGTAVDAWLSLRGRSVRDARPLSGDRLPLVVIAPGNFHAAYHHAALAEYLASHGYIVAAAPSQSRIGGPPAEGQSPRIGAEEQASDLRFIVSTLGSVAAADTNAVGIVAHSFGARSAFLVLIEDDPHVKALVSLDGGIANQAGKDWLTGVHWDPSAIRTPILHFYQEVDETVVPDFELISSLAGSERLLVRVDSLYHPHFTGLGTASGIVNGFKVGPDSPDVLAKVAAINRYTRRFLDTHVRGRPDRFAKADVVESNVFRIRRLSALR